MDPLTTSDARGIAILGIPLQLGAGKTGTVMGPAALRTADLAGTLRALGHPVTDYGDIAEPAPIEDVLAPEQAARCRNLPAIAGWLAAAYDRAYALSGHEDRQLYLGGDHTISMATIGAIARRCAEQGRELVVLWLDAHADFNTPESSPSGNMHGMSVAYLAGAPSLAGLLGDRPHVSVAAANMHLFGLRSVDPEERRRIDAAGFDAVVMRMIDEFGVSFLIGRILERLAGRDVHLHVSLDVDFLDPDIAPGAGTPVPGGATAREAHLVMEMLHDSGLVRSIDVVELNPFLDDRGRSAKLLADIIASLFGRSVLGRRPARRGC